MKHPSITKSPLFVLLFSTLTGLMQGESVFESFTYDIYNDEIVITGHTDSLATDIVIPEEIEGLPVTEIGYQAFSTSFQLTSISLPKTIENFNQGDFLSLAELTHIYVDENNPSLADLDGVLFNKDFSTLRYFPSGRSGHYSVPDLVMTIENSAFSRSSNLTSITIPESVTSIGAEAFIYSGLTDVSLPQGISTIDVRTFYGCGNLSSISLPANLTTIGQGAFFSCSKLTAISLPAGLTEIGSAAFRLCTSLTEVRIPDSVSKLGSAAFKSCNLTDITLSEGLTSIESDTFWNCRNLANVSLPSNLESIGSQAFYYCSGLSSIVLPETLTSIGYNAFAQCSGLTSISLPDKLTFLAAGAFSDCDRLISISLPNALKTIQDEALRNCSSLTELSFPAGLTEISYNALSGCGNISRLYFYGEPPEITPHPILGNRDLGFWENSITVHYAIEAPGWEETFSRQPTFPFVPGKWFRATLWDQNWMHLDWFGQFKSVTDDWTYHTEHGFQIVIGEETDSLYFYDSGIDSWLWSSNSLYPFFYHLGTNFGWVRYYRGGKPGKRVFHRLSDGKDLHESEM